MLPDAGQPPEEAPPPGAAVSGASAISRGRPVLYPRTYLWLVLISSLDIMLTWVILHVGGYEANPLAATIIERFDLWGAVSFKFFLVIVFLLACEFVGRRRPRTGRAMATIAVCIAAVPVVVAVVLLTRHM